MSSTSMSSSVSPEFLIELHTRTQQGLARIIKHCAELSSDELERELPGFGYPTIILQLDHIIGCEEYWFSVLNDNWSTEGSMPEEKTLASLEDYRTRAAAASVKQLQGMTSEWLLTPREFATWPEGTTRTLVPVMIVMRVLTHNFQHRGQIVAMCRLLGHPVPPSDFPLAP